MSGTDTLSARGISQRFGDRTVLEAVDLEVPAGRVIGLLGPNGAGRSTLMRILFGVFEPDAGTVAKSAAVSPQGTVSAYVPLTSPLLVPTRIAVGAAGLVELVASLLLLVGAIAVTARFGATGYARAIVGTGRRLKLRQALRA
ncbi:MAG: ATP-binding cassette domain-containing protein [Acidimicrobiales bacterium]